MIDTFYCIMETVTRVTKWIISAIMIFLTILVFYQVISRYLFGSTPTFIEEIARYSLIWLAFLGSSIAIRRGSHVSFNQFREKIPQRWGYVLGGVVNFIMIVFLFLLLWANVKYMSNQYLQISTTLNVSMAWPALGPVIGTLLMLLQSIEILIKNVRGESLC